MPFARTGGGPARRSRSCRRSAGAGDVAVKIAIYRVIQEALTNAWRHAGGVGQAVRVASRRSPHLRSKCRTTARDSMPATSPAERAPRAGRHARAGRESGRRIFASRGAGADGTRHRHAARRGRRESRMSEKLQIAIVDDHPLFREGVAQTLSAAAGYRGRRRGGLGRGRDRDRRGCACRT